MSDHPSYEVFIADPVPQDVIDLVPNGDKRMFSPLSITLVSGDRDAVLVDPPMTIAQTAAVGDWVESTGKNLTHIFVTDGHGDHWFGSAELAERFGAEVVNTAGTIEQMHANLAIREFFWDALFPGQIPATEVVAAEVSNNAIELEGHTLKVIEVGHTDTDDTSVLHAPSLDLVVAGDVIYNGVHQFLREAQGDGINAWLRAIDTVASLHPRLIVAGHKNKVLDDDARRTIRETREYLTTAAAVLAERTTALDFFNAMLQRFPTRLNPGALWGRQLCTHEMPRSRRSAPPRAGWPPAVCCSPDGPAAAFRAAAPPNQQVNRHLTSASPTCEPMTGAAMNTCATEHSSITARSSTSRRPHPAT